MAQPAQEKLRDQHTLIAQAIVAMEAGDKSGASTLLGQIDTNVVVVKALVDAAADGAAVTVL